MQVTQFFDNEVVKLQEQFNNTFGRLVTCDVDLRRMAIFAVIHLKLMAKDIAKAKDSEEKRARIRDFMEKKKIITGLFKMAEDLRKKQEQRYQRKDALAGQASCG